MQKNKKKYRIKKMIERILSILIVLSMLLGDTSIIVREVWRKYKRMSAKKLKYLLFAMVALVLLGAVGTHTKVLAADRGTIYEKNKMETKTFVGPFQFNMAGNSNCYGKYNQYSLWSDALHGNTSAESTVKTRKDYVAMEGLVGGDSTSAGANSNSSTSKLVPTTENSTIYKAYLVIAATQPTITSSNFSYLEEYGVYFQGPKKEIKKYFPSKVFYDDVSYRASFYVDVTDFVKQQGYGVYSCINIPYTRMTAKDTDRTKVDLFGSWKLVVIEEDTDLPIRMINLKLGGTSVTSASPANVSIQADGLVVKPDPTGELIFSMDGYDIGDSKQTLQYKTNVKNTYTKIYEYVAGTNTIRRGTDYFFSAQISNRGKNLTNVPDAAYAYAGTGNTLLSNVGTVYGGGTFKHFNTDYSIMTINDKNGINNVALKGGETLLQMKADTSNAPTLVSIMGLAVDIVVPKFESSIEVNNLTRHYSTSDKGYNIDKHYALPGDRLKVTATCKNVSSTSSNIGVKNAKLVVETPSFMDVDVSTISGTYTNAKGVKYTLAPSVSGNKVTFELNATITAAKNGVFTISYEGNSKTSNEKVFYENRVSAQGTFVDDSGKHYSSLELGNMGVAYVNTASDGPKYPLNVLKDGAGTVSGGGDYYGTATATVNYNPSSGY